MWEEGYHQLRLGDVNSARARSSETVRGGVEGNGPRPSRKKFWSTPERTSPRALDRLARRRSSGDWVFTNERHGGRGELLDALARS